MSVASKDLAWRSRHSHATKCFGQLTCEWATPTVARHKLNRCPSYVTWIREDGIRDLLRIRDHPVHHKLTPTVPDSSVKDHVMSSCTC